MGFIVYIVTMVGALTALQLLLTTGVGAVTLTGEFNIWQNRDLMNPLTDRISYSYVPDIRACLNYWLQVLKVSIICNPQW